MRHSRLTFVSAVAVFVSSIVPLAIRAQQFDVSGIYQCTSTGDAGGDFQMKLSQVGTTITGTYLNSVATLGGTLVGRRLDGTWRYKGDDGWLTFNFQPDGKSFEGEWGYHGEKPNGKWIGKRV